MSEDLSRRDQARAIYRVAKFRPLLTAGIISLSTAAALLEGVGLSFLLPIIELARVGPDAAAASDGAIGMFVSAYELVGMPFTLETVIVGVSFVMAVRYISSFLVSWLRGALEASYVRYLQMRGFELALDAEISYFDEQGSDEILNAIITQTRYGGQIIRRGTTLVEQSLIALVYLSIAVYLAPLLTFAAAVLLGVLTWLLRSVVESGYTVGDRLADANERIQEKAQAGMLGIRDIKLFGMRDELLPEFKSAVDQLAQSTVKIRRNKAALDNVYQLATAITVFILIYAALTITSLSLAGLGIFLFAIFRLAPRVSNLNKQLYSLEGDLPHLARSHQFIRKLADRQEPEDGDRELPAVITDVSFENVTFSYPTGEEVFKGLSMDVSKGEFVALVGPSGAGKSTLAALLSRMYEPDDGQVTANGFPIGEFSLSEWRDRVSVVRQSPHIFNDSLRRNVTIGNREAADRTVQKACDVAQVTEFLDELPQGYESQLGDDGVRLSGGQKQRIALARALLKDSDILVLDEATSDLDANLEEKVHEAIEKMEQERIVIVIAHRLSTVIDADCIYVFEDGYIVESGKHATLLAHNGTYSDLYKTQSDGFRNQEGVDAS